MDELIGVGEAARRLGLHENTVRNMAKDGRLPPANIPGSKRLKFRAEDIDRIAADRGEEVSSVVARAREVEPERVTANDLDAWGGRLAQEKAPEMLRRLLDATPGVTQVSARAGDGVALRGWDGVAISEGQQASYLPVGRLRFELGTDQKVASKAESDYQNRLSLDEEERLQTHFVFVTTRRWSGKGAWVDSKSAEGKFLSVSALDADDLEGWLQKTPSAHIWLSELLGRHPRDVQTIERWWDEFRTSTLFSMPESLFSANQEHVRDRLESFLRSTNPRKVLTIHGRSTDEALAVTYAALHAWEDRPSAIVVESDEAWARLSEYSVPHLLIPTFREPSVAAAADRGHLVVLLAHNGTALRPGADVVALALPGRSETSRTLQEAGMATPEAEKMAALYRRSPKAFFRAFALDPRAQSALPDSHRHDRTTVARLALAGQWSAGDGDHVLLERLVGVDWPKIESLVVALSQGDDPVFVRAGDAWRVAAPVEASLSFFPSLTSSDMGDWAKHVEEALFEVDPLDIPDTAERLAAQLRGQKRPHSRELEEGLAGGVALMALVEREVAGRRGSEWAEQVVSRVLSRAAKAGASGWKRIAHILPTLAEAAPDIVLDAVLDDLGSESPNLGSLFPVADRQSDFLAPASPHVHLLWALEVLARSAEYFASATTALAQLTDYDQGPDSSGNTAFRSLVNMLLPWVQYTDAGSKAKMAAIERLVDRRPELAWRLMLRLIPSSNEVSMHPSAPKYRDWGPESSEVTVAEWGAFASELMRAMIALAGNDLGRWADVVAVLDDLHPRDYDEATEAMLSAVSASEPASPTALLLWDSLNTEILRHTEYADAHWALPDDNLERLQRILAELPDPGKASTYAPLFGWDAGRAGLDSEDPAAMAEWPNKQRDAVAEIAQMGRAELERLIDKVDNPHAVGITFAGLSNDEFDAWALGWLLAEGQPRRQAAQSYFSGRSQTDGGRAWIEAKLRELQDAPEDRLALALTPEPNPSTWAMFERIAEDLVDGYWRSVNPWSINEGDRLRAFQELIHRHRPVSALLLFDLAVIRGEQAESTEMGPTEAIAALDEILSGNSAEEIRGSHRIGSALDFLASNGVADDQLARYEFLFYPLLGQTAHQPTALYRVLRTNPSEFVGLVCLSTRPASRAKEESKDPAAVALAWRVLRDWKQLPGTDGTTWVPDAEVLKEWIIECRSLFSERDRAQVGDEMLGSVLAYGANEASEGWPAIPVREVLETFGSQDMETGFYRGILDARRTWTKGIYEGGEQERELSVRFQARAEECRDWRRSNRALKAVARSYEREAQRADAEAKWDADGA
ncbi:helix-turn-helix domain-containing protein [Microbacterium sp. A196]|uniref:helix-turn-helix domain-containing protein n=1 Tax=Microbacterium sp. A196 TaxID=3457320 RepID=UPI003FD50422